MQPFRRGFVHELVKLGGMPFEKDVYREAQREAKELPKDNAAIQALRPPGPVTRNYMAATLIGAAAPVLLAIAGQAVSRAIHNRSLMRALEETHLPSKRHAIRSEMMSGPLIGRIRPDLPVNKRPLVTINDMMSNAAQGALASSVIQMIRDRYSGSG